MFKDMGDLPFIGNWPKNEGERVEMPVSRKEAPPAGEPILKSWWKLFRMRSRLRRWWRRLVRH